MRRASTVARKGFSGSRYSTGNFSRPQRQEGNEGGSTRFLAEHPRRMCTTLGDPQFQKNESSIKDFV